MSSDQLPIIEPLNPTLVSQAAKENQVPDYMCKLNIFRVLLKSPKNAKILNDLLMALIVGSKLDHRYRELIIMRIAWLTGSVYEWVQHFDIAKSFKLSEEEILSVRDPQASSRLTQADKAVLRATDEFVENNEISVETYALLKNYIETEEELIDLTLAIGLWFMVAGILKSLKIPIEEGKKPWPPDGLSPIITA